MNASLVELLKADIDEHKYNIDEDIKILRIQYLKKSEKLRVALKYKYDLGEEKKNLLISLICKRLNSFSNIEVLWYRDIDNVSIDEVAGEYWIDVVNSVASSFPSIKSILLKAEKKISENIVVLYLPNVFMCNVLKNKNIESLVKKTVRDMFGLNISVNMVVDNSVKGENYFDEKELENTTIIKEALSNIKVSSDKPQDKKENADKPFANKEKAKDYVKYKKSQEPLDENVIFGRNINEEAVAIKELDISSGKVAITGDIFKVNIFESKSGRVFPSAFITDYSSSITVKIYPRANDDLDKILGELKEGLHCKVYGEVEIDRFTRELVITARSIVKLKKIERMDTAEEKRVELHAHTTMSSMDGLTSAGKLVARAAKWGHSAIAITDHGVAQAFPEAMEAGKKHNIKLIYGIEGYLVDDGVPIAINSRGKTFNDTFVVFDIETTGFSSENDRIIEIGAVKIHNGKVIDSFNYFVNPNRSIPYKITELTGINNDMVKDADSIEVVLPKFLNFINDSIVVAHNAEFDTGFIKVNCRRIGVEFSNGILDTLPLARFLFPELKKHKLNVICDHLDISLENHHRAVDDAAATGEILLRSFKLLEDQEITDIDSLNREYLKTFDIKKAPTYHVIILSKTQQGLKNLYKLISYSNLNHFHRRPRMPKSLIEEHRDGLIIGSACEAGQVFKGILSGKNFQDLEHVVNFYDYLEIQPIGNNDFLIKKNSVKDEEALRELNRRICELGTYYNKPVVATGDVHFLDPTDEAFRRILMAGKGFDDADNQPPLYLKTTTEMLREFSYLGDKKAREVVITNPRNISESIEIIKPIPDETYPPKIPGAEDDIRNMTMEKVKAIYGEDLPEVIQKRLDKELNSIIGNGYAVLYLIAHKLVAKSISDGYLVGSRGSVGSSFVATMTDITEVNGLPPHYVCPNCKHSEFFMDGSVGSGVDLPDKNCEKCGSLYIKDGHDIPFETFLGFEGDKEPDIDLNFSGDNQGDIHKYTEVLFGKGYTFKAGTIGTIAEKTAYGYVKKYLDERGVNTNIAEIERLTLGCTGVKRTTGQHPGGIMVVPSDNEIFNFCPIQRPADDPNSDIVTTHFDYHSISGRLLKLDILGHDDPTVLRMLQDITGIDPKTVPLSDPKVISIFTSTDALGLTPAELGCEVGSYGIPEFGTKFVRQMLIDTQPKSFADLVRISGLSHGTDVWLNNAQYYIKEGFTTLKDCISTRDDIMVYLIYKGLPPKTAFNIMEKVRKGKGLSEDHEAIMREHNVPDWYIGSCKKIKYMFPKGHAVAYVMMAVRIAYFKVYYPKAYYATYFTVRADDFDGDIVIKGEEAIKDKMDEINALGNNMGTKEKGLLTILELAYEMYKRGIKFLPVDIYKSEATKFTVEGDFIRISLSGLQGVGVNAAKAIAEVRNNGEFISKEDLRNRSKATKTVIEALSNHGALGDLPETNQLSLF
ncbi:PolC-type DNA polymerase III [Clostridium sp.]|uniref:PolC-type DNA polymerase III n=1 Tax=Clostridium sp. TaxID=1506 RepID=UPI002FCCB129